MEPSSKQDEVVNMTRAKEALSPWLNHPRKTIIQVEGLVVAAAALLLLQLILGSCKRRWHRSFLKYGLQACNGIMFPLIVYTLGTMQSSPIKNSSYPIWAAFLIMASAGTIAVQQYDFYDSYYKKYIQISSELFRDLFYAIMFVMLMTNPNNYNFKTAWDLMQSYKNGISSPGFVIKSLVFVVFSTKMIESIGLLFSGYKGGLFFLKKKSRRRQDAERRTEETAKDHASDSDPQSMKGYKYTICYGSSWLTIDQLWHCCGNSADGNALKDLCLSCALFWRLMEQHYFGEVCRGTRRLEDHDFVFKKLLPPEGDLKRAFKIIEVELGFCYDFFFTKYFCTFIMFNTQRQILTRPLFLLKIIFIVIVGVFTIRKSVVLRTPIPIIEVHISEADYVITLLVLGISLIVELVQVAFYLASNWAQVSLACIYAKKHWCQPYAFILREVVSFLRRVVISGQLRNKIDQHSFLFRRKQPDAVEVSDAVKEAIASSLRSTYGNNLSTSRETTLWQNEMFDKYSWALKDLSRLEVMLIWHIATEYCDISEVTSSNEATPSSNHRGAHLFGYMPQLLRPEPRRNRIPRDGPRGVAVHLSRYYAYLIGCVPELLPYHEADIAELSQEVMEERKELFPSCCRLYDIYYEMQKIGTEEEEDPKKIFKKGVKLGMQLEVGHRWEVLKNFWTETIIHVAASHYTAKQHMQHLENGGEFLTHIWALLAHAGILNLNRGKDQEGQANPGSSPSAAV